MNETDFLVVFGYYLVLWAIGYGMGIGFYTVKKVLEGSAGSL